MSADDRPSTDSGRRAGSHGWPTDGVDADTVRALGHPLRLRILELTLLDGEVSPVGLARRLDEPLSTVSKHMRMLRDLGFVELTHTLPRRGAVEHFYRATRMAFIDDEEWERLPIVMRRGLARQTLRRLFAEASAAGGRGGFDSPHAHLSRYPLRLDADGRRELSAALQRLLAETADIQRRSDERRRSDDEGILRASLLALAFFDVAEDDDGSE